MSEPEPGAKPEPEAETAETTDTASPKSPNDAKQTAKGPSVKVTRAKTPDHAKKDVVKRLESGGRILSLIKKAETKRVAKRKIITFLKKKGVSETKIIEAYTQYYKEEGLYEITFNQRPLGFSVIMDTRGKNAIVSSIQDDNNSTNGMKIASRVYEINGKRVDDIKHKEILKLMSTQQCPFYVVFKESQKKSSALAKKRKKQEEALKWQDDGDDEIESDSDSDTVSSYSSDDDEAHVAHHYSRKNQASKKNKKKKNVKVNKNNDSLTLFKPNELDQWEDDRIEDEQAAMLKELSRLMMGAVTSAEQSGAFSGGPAPKQDATKKFEIDGMTHKRQRTLKTLFDVTTPKPNEQNRQDSISRKFSVGDLTAADDEEEYDPEIFRYLSQLVQPEQPQDRPLTPSTNKLMKDLFIDATEEEIALNLPDFGTPSTKNSAQHQSNQSSSSISELKENDDNQDEDVIESLENGTTLLKYGKYGKPKYKMFHLTPDHKYLVWFSQKKSSEETRIKIKEIKKIAIGSDSKVVEKTKKKDLHETSFTIFYGKSSNEKEQKQLTVTAKNEKEAFVWAQGLKILSDAAKKGQHLRTLSKNAIQATNDDNMNNDNNDNKKRRPKHHKTESVIISMDQLHRQSVLNIFSKSNESSVNSLLKQHNRLKQQLQKCVDFVMTKANYRAIANAGQFEKVKAKLEDLDNRLRDVKTQLTTNVDNGTKELSSVKAELFSCNADLDALKQKLTAIVRRPQKL